MADTGKMRTQITSLARARKQLLDERFKRGTKVKVRVKYGHYYDEVGDLAPGIVQHRCAKRSVVLEGVIGTPAGLWGKQTVVVEFSATEQAKCPEAFSSRNHGNGWALATYTQLEKINPV
jgi:hypothetical protein